MGQLSCRDTSWWHHLFIRNHQRTRIQLLRPTNAWMILNLCKVPDLERSRRARSDARLDLGRAPHENGQAFGNADDDTALPWCRSAADVYNTVQTFDEGGEVCHRAAKKTATQCPRWAGKHRVYSGGGRPDAQPQGSSLRNFSDWPQRSHRNVSNVGFSGRTSEPASSILLAQRRQTCSSPVSIGWSKYPLVPSHVRLLLRLNLPDAYLFGRSARRAKLRERISRRGVIGFLLL